MTDEVLSIHVMDNDTIQFKSFPDSFRIGGRIAIFTVNNRPYYIDSCNYPDMDLPHIYVCGRNKDKDNYPLRFTGCKDVLWEFIRTFKALCKEKGITFNIDGESIVLGGL